MNPPNKPKIIAQGAEAIISLNENVILKDRVRKSYRLPELDEKIRKSRTKRESKLLEKASKLINVPKVLQTEKFNLNLEFINGERLSETLHKHSEKEQFQILNQIGEQVSTLHESNIIHGDLTTSNTILKEKKVFIIDFGLGFISLKLDDKAVDLHLIKQALEAKHFQNHEELFKQFLEGYRKQNNEQAFKVLKQLEKVEARGRYKH
jgi:TP53 regulating kinase and related kinases